MEGEFSNWKSVLSGVHINKVNSNGSCYSIIETYKCLQTGHGNTRVNYEKGGTIVCKTVREKVVTINANMKVSEQCRIAASRSNQILGMIRRNRKYKE